MRQKTLDADDAREAVAAALLGIVPDAELDTVDDDEPVRDALELDSMDFLSFVETLSARTGVRIDESDYPRLTTMADCIGFLTERSA